MKTPSDSAVSVFKTQRPKLFLGIGRNNKRLPMCKQLLLANIIADVLVNALASVYFCTITTDILLIQ